MRKTNLIIGILFVCIFVTLARQKNKQTEKTKSKQTVLKTGENDSLKNENSFIEIEDWPSFPDGEMKLFEFLDKNLDKKLVANPKLEKGICVIHFQIDTLGKVENFKVVKSYNHDVDSEFMRVLKLMPNWKPGRKLTNISKGTWVKVSCYYTMPLRIPYERK